METSRCTVNIMTVNLRFGLADDGKNSWENRKQTFPELFRTHAPDFIGVQEANNFQTAYLSHILENYNHIGECESSPDFWQDNIIYYRKTWACEDSRHYFLSETPSVISKLPDSQWQRQCTIGLFKNKDRELIHANTHFDFKASVQEKSVGFVMDFLNDFPEDTPTIITGDFNTSPDSRTYALFMEQGFKDLFVNEHSSTFHGFTGKALGGHIDWILYRGKLVGTGHRVIRDTFSGLYPSDHYPVESVFELY